MPTILLARHGQASYGGSDYDVLSALGATQADVLAAELTARGLDVSELVSGSLSRQRDTAAPSAAALGRAVAVDPRFNEYDMDDILGSHSGTDVRVTGSSHAISSREFQDLLDGALVEWIAAGTASGAAETFPAFKARVSAGLRELAERLASGTTGVAFTSGGVLAAVCIELLGLTDDAFTTFNRVTINAGITKVIHGRRGATLVSFNDHSHLERAGTELVTYR
jgi:broad specificity phosphatase PhoE